MAARHRLHDREDVPVHCRSCHGLSLANFPILIILFKKWNVCFYWDYYEPYGPLQPPVHGPLRGQRTYGQPLVAAGIWFRMIWVVCVPPCTRSLRALSAPGLGPICELLPSAGPEPADARLNRECGR